MNTLYTFWGAISQYITAGTVVSIAVSALLVLLKYVKYKKASDSKVLTAIREQLASLSVNKEVRLTLETLAKGQLKEIKKELMNALVKTLDGYVKDLDENVALTKAIAAALASLKQMPADRVNELNAALGLTAPATIIELKPVDLEPVPEYVAPMAMPSTEPKHSTHGRTKLNPFGG